MEQVVSTKNYTPQNGVLFNYKRKTWIGFDGTSVPADVVGSTNWRFLRYDGLEVEKETLANAAPQWKRGRDRMDRLVGYWYEGAELKKRPVVSAPAAEQFEQKGMLWTRCDPKGKCPERLKKKSPGFWWRMEPGGYVEIGTGHADEGDYWGPNRSFEVVAFCIPAEDRISSKSSVTPEAAGVHDVLIKPEQAKKAAELTSLEEVKANQGMLLRDGVPEDPKAKHDRLVTQLVGNGMIFAPPKREVHPLYRVAPMTSTGTSLWGAGHEAEA